ncbi:MAG: hypothetical protein OXG72_05640, partial [Acidobacteria bacterium]|nr:hypothetical protein [Acidobacteriota bacterium]
NSPQCCATPLVNANILKPSSLADTTPGVLEISEMRALQAASDDPRIVIVARESRQPIARLRSQRH